MGAQQGRFERSARQLALFESSGSLGGALGTRDEREGRHEHQCLVLDLRSVHALQGRPLPVAERAGIALALLWTPPRL